MSNNDYKLTLRAARINAGLSAEEVGKRIGKCAETVRKYETGKSVPDWNVVDKMLDIYQLKLDDISFPAYD